MLESYVWNSVATNHDMDADAQRYLGLTHHHLRARWPARAPSRSASTRCRWSAPPSTPPRTRTSRCGCTRRCGRSCRACRRWRACTRRCEQPLVPVLLAHGALRRAGRSRAAARAEPRVRAGSCRSCCCRRIARPATNSTSSPQAAAADPVRAAAAAGQAHARPPGSPRPPRTCSRSSPRTIALPRIVLEYRALAKLKSTYTDKLPELVNERTGRIHTCYAQAVAATGRLSSVDPNLQNIPVRRPEGRRIRQAFVAPAGYVLLAADYSQIELRIMAHLSGDDGLQAAFAEDRDVHQATAAEVFGVALDAVNADQRRTAKVINFGLIYGMSAVRARAQPRHRPRRRAAVRGALLPALSGREALHGQHARAGARARATSRRCSGGACTCRTSAPATRRCASTPSAAPSTRPCRARLPTSSSAP